MLETLITTVSNFIIMIIDSSGFWGVVLLMGIESAAIPLPSEIILPFAGFLASQDRFTLLEIALAGALGSVLGSWVVYGIARYGGRPLVKKYGHLVLISRDDLDRVDRFFKKFGTWAVLIGRVLPIVRTYISIPAGVARVKFLPFTLTAFVGSFIWSLFLGWIGFRLGANWEMIRGQTEGLNQLIALIVIALIVWWVIHHFQNRVK